MSIWLDETEDGTTQCLSAVHWPELSMVALMRIASETDSVHSVVIKVLGPPVDATMFGYPFRISLANPREQVAYKLPVDC